MKTFKATPEMIQAAETLFLAMAYQQTVKPIIEKIEQDILDKNRYRWDFEKVTGGIVDGQARKRDFAEFVTKHGEYCSREFDTYLISDKNFGHYLTEKHAKVIAAGFEVEFGYCPRLIAESQVRDAQRLLIEVMEPVTGITYDNIVSTYKGCKEHLPKMVDLTLRLLAPYTDSKKILATL